MSHISKAVIHRAFHDRECIQEALEELNVSYRQQGNSYVIGGGLTIENTSNGCLINYYYERPEHLSFLSDFTRMYDLKIEEKIEKLRLEEARFKEEAALQQFSQEEIRKQELELRRKRMKMENERKKELEKINQKVNNILERAKKYGYEIREERVGTERIIQLVKRI